MFRKKKRPLPRGGEQHDTYDMELIKEMKSLCGKLRTSIAQFDFATDEDLINACIYENNAIISRINYLVRRAKDATPEEPAEESINN